MKDPSNCSWQNMESAFKPLRVLTPAHSADETAHGCDCHLLEVIKIGYRTRRRQCMLVKSFRVDRAEVFRAFESLFKNIYRGHMRLGFKISDESLSNI
jgi:ethanolamine utilization cobalamin adenosyltransferase